ncbi:LysR family transcriptional regulator [Plantactinospora sp. GCM10030261]|uniref:LysR family transcriptional regulator n=1 Tax=Plantactinospora sp. GCM10030261 TaxID=3273420 RepID=UPI0036086948
MDPQWLRTLVVVARTGSFSAAARELGYTQSAVSQQIAALEADLGTPLLGRRPVVPTEAGTRLLEHAGPILLRLDAARADVTRMVGTPPEALTLGVTPLAFAAPVAAALADVRGRRPRLDASVRVTGRTAVVADVATGAVDLVLTDGVAAPSDPLRLPGADALRRARVTERPLAVAVPSGHPLAGWAGLRLPDLVDARWIEAPDVAAPLGMLRAAVGGDGFRPALRYTGTDVAGLLTLVAAGHGLAVLPTGPWSANSVAGTADPGQSWTGAVGPVAGSVVAVPLRTPPLVHRIELLHGHLASPAARWLAAALIDRLDVGAGAGSGPGGHPNDAVVESIANGPEH